MQFFISISDVSEEKKIEPKQVYTEFPHQPADLVSDPHNCQSLPAQAHSTTLISQPREKKAQLSSNQTSESEFLKVLGAEDEPHLQAVRTKKMAEVQGPAELMTAQLSESQQGNTSNLQAYQCVHYVHTCMHACDCALWYKVNIDE